LVLYLNLGRKPSSDTRRVGMNAINPLDPTFGAIEHHRLRSSALNDVAFAPEPDRDAYEAAYAAEEEALDALCCTPPTTAAGARAGIEYAITVEDFHGVPVARAYLANLLASPILPSTSPPIDATCLDASRLLGQAQAGQP
jgi:hypothetical protein